MRSFRIVMATWILILAALASYFLGTAAAEARSNQTPMSSPSIFERNDARGLSRKACEALLQEIARLEAVADVLIEDFDNNRTCKPGPQYEECRDRLAARLELILNQLISRENEYEAECHTP